MLDHTYNSSWPPYCSSHTHILLPSRSSTLSVSLDLPIVSCLLHPYSLAKSQSSVTATATSVHRRPPPLVSPTSPSSYIMGAPQVATRHDEIGIRAAALRRHGDKLSSARLANRMVVKIDIYADLLCPWCFIEKHSLEELMAQYQAVHPEMQFEVAWKPFYINPLMKKNLDKRTMYEKAGSPADYAEFLNRIQTVGAKQDIAFSIRGRSGPTRNAHKLISLALQEQGPDAQAQVVEQLFQGHFEDGRDITDEDWLVAIGVEAGIPEGRVRLELEDEDAGRRIDAEVEENQQLRGVEAVPCVVVQGKYKVGGYQEAPVFQNLFDKIRMAR